MNRNIRRRASRCIWVLSALVLAMTALAAASGPAAFAAGSGPYTIEDLGTLNGWDTSSATAVNDRGEVVGFSYDNSGTVEAFRWSRFFGMMSLGSGSAYGLNDVGQVVGQSGGHAVIWDRWNGIVDLGPGYARAVNDAGTVVGQNGEGHAFVWTQATGMVDLGAYGGISSWASAVNEAGQVVGAWTDSSYVNHAFLWSPRDGNADFGANTNAAAVNGLGQVAGNAGVYSAPLWPHATLWTSGSASVDLGTLGPSYSYARGMNDEGVVVGMSHAVWPAGLEHAFVWTQADGMLDLGTLGGLSSNAADVNNRGLIVGGAYTSGPNSVAHATIWTPTDTRPPVAPSTPDLWAGTDSGHSNSDDITKSTMPSFTGTGEPGATITLHRGAAAVRTLYADTLTGAWGGADYTVTADGIYNYTATATDAAGNTSPASGALVVTVDTHGPTLTAPGLTADATGPDGAVVDYSVVATDTFDQTPTVLCSPAVGSLFPIGDTPLNCTADDDAGNTARASFTVHVRGAAEQLASLATAVSGVGPGTSLADKISGAQTALTTDGKATSSILNAFMQQIAAQQGKTIPAATAASLTNAARQIIAILA